MAAITAFLQEKAELEHTARMQELKLRKKELKLKERELKLREEEAKRWGAGFGNQNNVVQGVNFKGQDKVYTQL